MPARETVEQLNDRLAREHPIDDYYARSPGVVRWIEGRRLDIIRAMVGPEDGLCILEVGSGGGHVLRMFPRARLTACDVSEIYLDTARKNLAGGEYDVEFHKGEIQDLALPAASFDRVICTEVLEHTREPTVILAEIARLLAPAGRAVITVPNDALINSVKKIVRITPIGWALRNRLNWGGDEYHLHQWSPAEFRRLLGIGFEVEEQRAAPFDWLPIRACYRCSPL